MLKLTIAIGLAAAAICLGQTASPVTPAAVADAKTRIKEISPGELKTLSADHGKYTLIDVREDSEWARSHAAGALHISRGAIDKEIASKAPDKDAKVILYCQGGNRSALAADTLQKMGYTNVFSLAGGFGAYEKLGLPVEK